MFISELAPLPQAKMSKLSKKQKKEILQITKKLALEAISINRVSFDELYADVKKVYSDVFLD